MNLVHKNIRRFNIEGVIYDDSQIPRLKDTYVRMLVEDMRYRGWVRRIDLDTDFSLDYDGKKYNFSLTIYGVYIGKANAKWVDSVDKNRPVPFTQKNKSDDPLPPQDSISKTK